MAEPQQYQVPGQTPPMETRARSSLGLAFGLTLLFLSLSFLPRVQENPRLLASFLVAGGVLLIWMAWLKLSAVRASRTFGAAMSITRAHWVQALVHLCVYAYWGWYWSPVYEFLGLLFAQLVFSYVLTALLSWSRGKVWLLGFGAFPIVFSTNLFIWFKDDWFALQFLLLAVGYLGKELITWQRDGQRRHIFNPSGFSLSVFSVVLILTNGTGITWGVEIASTLPYPPYMYICIFALGLVVQSLFAVTLTTLGAAFAIVILNFAYYQVSDISWFFSFELPLAIFLGLHLLVTDPATSPRTELGRLIFGLLYGISAFALHGLLEGIRAPEFYDKLLAVPLLNLSVQVIDRFVRSPFVAGFRGATLGMKTSARNRNLVYMGVWTVLFLGMYSADFVKKDSRGNPMERWTQACDENLRRGCFRLARVYEGHCHFGDSTQCFKLGVLNAEGKKIERNDEFAALLFDRACRLGNLNGCIQAAAQYVVHDMRYNHPDPLLSAVKMSCESDHRSSCFLLAVAYEKGSGVERDVARARSLYERACTLRSTRGCEALDRLTQPGSGATPN